MEDKELKRLLLETCPVRPGQEERAWTALRQSLFQARPSDARVGWRYLAGWRGAAFGVVMAGALFFVGNNLMRDNQPAPSVAVTLPSPTHTGVTADSEAPGVYASCFYSAPAHAQVVWLSGLDPVTDQPTYLDPTTIITSPADESRSPGVPVDL